MPDQNGKLTAEETQKVIQWVNSHWLSNAQCELCGQKNKWIPGQQIVAAANLSLGSTYTFQGPTYPSIPILCPTCGNTKYLNAIISGIVPGKAPNAR